MRALEERSAGERRATTPRHDLRTSRPRSQRAPEEAGPAAEGPACRSCGAPVDPRQLVCLECGARVALKEQRSWATEPGADRRAPRRRDRDRRRAVRLRDLGADERRRAAARPPQPRRRRRPAGGARPAPRARPSSRARDRSRALDAGPPPPRSPRANPNAIPGWPAGITAHTVVLVTTSDEPAARNVAREARRAGLEAGLIRSDPYDLGTGLWIVFTGRFDTREGAVRQAAGLQQQYPGAYPQLDSEGPVAPEHPGRVRRADAAARPGAAARLPRARSSSRRPSRRERAGRSRPPARRPPARRAPRRAHASGSPARRRSSCRAPGRRAGRPGARRSRPRSGSGQGGTGGRPARPRARPATGRRPHRSRPAPAG